jgi:hypothetical protein
MSNQNKTYLKFLYVFCEIFIRFYSKNGIRINRTTPAPQYRDVIDRAVWRSGKPIMTSRSVFRRDVVLNSINISNDVTTGIPQTAKSSDVTDFSDIIFPARNFFGYAMQLLTVGPMWWIWQWNIFQLYLLHILLYDSSFCRSVCMKFSQDKWSFVSFTMNSYLVMLLVSRLGYGIYRPKML